MMRMLCFTMALALAGAAGAEQYWIAYEANDFPENEGWERAYGDGNNPPEDEPDRWLEDGLLVVDTSRDPQLWEYYVLHRAINPGPDEAFVAEWSVRCDLLSGIHDAGVSIARDEPPGKLGFFLTEDSLEIWGEGVFIPISPGELHAYRLESADMQTYQLFIDGQLAHTSDFWSDTAFQSRVAFGSGTQGASSVTYYDYFRFGIVPEPGSALLWAAPLCLMTSRGFGRAVRPRNQSSRTRGF